MFLINDICFNKKIAMSPKQLNKDIEVSRKKLNLVNGDFTPSEAADLINNLIDEKINFHKIQRLQLWEGNHNCDIGFLNSRITELEVEREKTMDFIAKLRLSGKSIHISGQLELTTVETHNN